MAAQGDHAEAARVLLSRRAPVDDVTVDYLTALHVAAHCGHAKVAKLLLDRWVNAEMRLMSGVFNQPYGVPIGKRLGKQYWCIQYQCKFTYS